MTQTEEIHAIHALADRLRGRFPDTPPENITKAVDEVHQQFDGRPIRDFIPVLVEREVVDRFMLPQAGLPRER